MAFRSCEQCGRVADDDYDEGVLTNDYYVCGSCVENMSEEEREELEE